VIVGEGENDDDNGDGNDVQWPEGKGKERKN
jgi:hypothetical protein